MRLIDADALIEAINKSTCQWEYLWKRVVCDVIRNQPTAYDVEAVVAKLKVFGFDTIEPPTEYEQSLLTVVKKRAISIVRNGGKE